MDKSIAEKTSLVMLMVNSLINSHLQNLQGELPDQEFSEYTRKSGKVMTEIYLKILRPLWKEHPELLPKQMEGGYVVNEKMYDDLLEILNRYAAVN